MKSRVLIAAGVLAMTPLLGVADDAQRVTVTGSAADAKMSLDEQAMNACFNDFIGEIMPNGQINVRTVSPGDTAVMQKGDPLLRYRQMIVTMEARSADDNAVLASAKCKVDSNARISYMKTKVRDADALAGITTRDLRLVASIR